MSLDAITEGAKAAAPLAQQCLGPDELFHREWVRNLFSLAVDDLRRACAATDKAIHFALFERYDLADSEPHGRPTYADLAREFTLSVTQVTNFLAAVRRRFRHCVLDRLRAATASKEEFEAEARRLLGGEAS